MTLCDTGELFGLYSNANYVLVVPNLVCCFIYLAVWLAVRKKVQGTFYAT
jgi:hypothetical protein